MVNKGEVRQNIRTNKLKKGKKGKQSVHIKQRKKRYVKTKRKQTKRKQTKRKKQLHGGKSGKQTRQLLSIFLEYTKLNSKSPVYGTIPHAFLVSDILIIKEKYLENGNYKVGKEWEQNIIDYIRWKTVQGNKTKLQKLKRKFHGFQPFKKSNEKLLQDEDILQIYPKDVISSWLKISALSMKTSHSKEEDEEDEEGIGIDEEDEEDEEGIDEEDEEGIGIDEEGIDEEDEEGIDEEGIDEEDVEGIDEEGIDVEGIDEEDEEGIQEKNEDIELYLKFINDKRIKKIKLKDTEKHEIIFDKIKNIVSDLETEVSSIAELLIWSENKYSNISKKRGINIINKIINPTRDRWFHITKNYKEIIRKIIETKFGGKSKEYRTKKHIQYDDFKPFVYKTMLQKVSLEHMDKLHTIDKYLTNSVKDIQCTNRPYPTSCLNIINRGVQSWISPSLISFMFLKYFNSIPSLPPPSLGHFGHKGFLHLWDDFNNPEHPLYLRKDNWYYPEFIARKIVPHLITEEKKRKIEFNEEQMIIKKLSNSLLENNECLYEDPKCTKKEGVSVLFAEDESIKQSTQ